MSEHFVCFHFETFVQRDIEHLHFVSGVLTFAKFVKFRKSRSRTTARGGTQFLVFQPENMLNLCLNVNEPQPTYDYKRYAYTKRMDLHSSQR